MKKILLCYILKNLSTLNFGSKMYEKRTLLNKVYVVGQLSSRTRHRVLAVAALDKRLGMV